jgi:hypothetical protein
VNFLLSARNQRSRSAARHNLEVRGRSIRGQAIQEEFVMKHRTVFSCCAALLFACASPAFADDHHNNASGYNQRNLVSDGSITAEHTDAISSTRGASRSTRSDSCG